LKTTLVLGIGNTLLADEGVGIHTIHYLQNHHSTVEGVEYMDGGTLSFTLALPVEDADQLIVIDAAQMDTPPGTVRTFEGDEMDRFLNSGKRTPHEVSVSDLLAMAQLTGRFPENRALIGIQPQQLDWGDDPTPAVAKAIPVAAAEVLRLVNSWRAQEVS